MTSYTICFFYHDFVMLNCQAILNSVAKDAKYLQNTVLCHIRTKVFIIKISKVFFQSL